MSAGIWFWLIYVICLVFGAYFNWPHDGRYHALGSSLVLFVLLGLLG